MWDILLQVVSEPQWQQRARGVKRGHKMQVLNLRSYFYFHILSLDKAPRPSQKLADPPAPLSSCQKQAHPKDLRRSLNISCWISAPWNMATKQALTVLLHQECTVPAHGDPFLSKTTPSANPDTGPQSFPCKTSPLQIICSNPGKYWPPETRMGEIFTEKLQKKQID